MELVCVDYLSLEVSKGGYENILVITDHFSRYAQAIPTRNQTAKTTARMLFENFFVHYGYPAGLHSDKGANLESKVIKHLCRITGTKKSRTTPYHPKGNGMVERFNQTLLNMMGTLPEYKKADWKAHVPTLTHAYNAAVHESTGFAPYYIVFGRHPRLAIDAFLGIPTSHSTTSHANYAEKLNSRLSAAYEIARKESKKAGNRYKLYYDQRVRYTVLRPGDRVLVRNVGIKGKHKLADTWETEPYIVKRKPIPDIPVFEVYQERGNPSKCRILHRNMLLPFMSVLDVSGEMKSGEEVEISTSRGEPSSSDSSPESEEEIMSEEEDPQADRYVIPMRRPPVERIGNNRGAPGLHRQLPRRQRRAPPRFQAGKLHTFAVPASNVVFL